MKNIIYGARVSGGSYDDHWECIKFVSLDRKLAEKWVEKYNSLLEKLTSFYEHKYLTFPKKGDYHKNTQFVIIANRYYKLYDLWEAVVDEFELR